MLLTLLKCAPLTDLRVAQCPDCAAVLRWSGTEGAWCCPTDLDHGCGPLAAQDVYVEHDERWLLGEAGVLVVGRVPVSDLDDDSEA